jgi:hypothetical protein
LWPQLPAVKHEANGIGLYAINRAGRSRWGSVPSHIYADDTFVKRKFRRDERIIVPGRYFWPVPNTTEGLLKARARWTFSCQQVDQYIRRDHRIKDYILEYLWLGIANPISMTIVSWVFFMGRRYDVQKSWHRQR